MKAANTIVGVLMVLILLMAVAVPIISEMETQAEDPVYSQNSVGSGKLMEKSTSLSLVLAKTESGITAGGTAVSSGYTIVSSSLIGTVTDAGSLAVVYKADNTVAYHIMSNVGSTLTFSGSSWTLDSSATVDEVSTDLDATSTFSYVFHEDADGDWLRTTAPVFVDGDSTFYAYGFTRDTGRLLASGTIDSGLTAVFNYYNNSPTFTIGATETDYTNTLNTVSLATSGGASGSLTDFIVPVDYTTGYSASIVSTLIGIMPVILLAALVTAVVFRMIAKRED